MTRTGVPLKDSLKNIKEKKKNQQQKKTLQLKSSNKLSFHPVILTAANFAQRTFFLEMSPLVPVLPFNSAGNPLCPVLVTGDSFDMASHSEEGTWDGFDPQVSALGRNNSKDWWRKERERFM